MTGSLQCNLDSPASACNKRDLGNIRDHPFPSPLGHVASVPGTRTHSSPSPRPLSRRHLRPHASPASATLHPHTPHTPSPHEARPRYVHSSPRNRRRPASAAPSPLALPTRTQPSPLPLLPRRTSLICTTYTTAVLLSSSSADTLTLLSRHRLSRHTERPPSFCI